ncbi:MAG: peptidoglycan-binding protein [Oscillospiraceae bacterium]|nr:peptidoglycan-binding protein [Oscillospiraceae bacterium]
MAPVPALAGDKATANGHVYFRKGPGTNYEILLVLAPNAKLDLISQEGDWYKATYGKKTGYVRQDVITLVGKGSASVAPATTNYRTLSKGDTGDDVFRLEEALIFNGHFDLMPDKKFDETTENAIKAYQKAKGLKADGIAGQKTQELLFMGIANSNGGNGNASVSTTDGSETLIVVDDGTLRLGSKGEAVRTLQSRLQQLGYLAGKVDGSFGTATEVALKAFQTANKLSSDGVAGSATQQALYASSAKAASGGQTTTPVASGALKEGSSGDAVKQMQTTLKNLNYYTGSLTGNFGPITTQAVRDFQRANSLTADGIAGSGTLNKLYSGNVVAKGGKVTSSGTNNASAGSGPRASSVIMANWYTSIRTKYKAGTVVTIYDFHTGLSWRCRFMSNGKHADSEPLTASDTTTMVKAFGGKHTWNPKSVWVTMPDGKTYIASMHDMPHLTGSIRDNNFDGHLCIHFPREMKEAEETGPYAVSHQEEILAGWAQTKKMAN